MKSKLLVGIAAAVMLLTVPASAEVYGRFGDDDGVSIRVGPDRYRDWDRGRHYGWYQHYRDRACATVTIRERLPDGRVIVRTRERC